MAASPELVSFKARLQRAQACNQAIAGYSKLLEAAVQESLTPGGLKVDTMAVS
jgi:hypothetical protein